MSDELVTISRPLSPLDAQLLRTRLEADGIFCQLKGESVVATVGSPNYLNTSFENPLGTIEVQVCISDKTDALAILDELKPAHNPKVLDSVRDHEPGIFWFVIKVFTLAFGACAVGFVAESFRAGLGEYVATAILLVGIALILRRLFKVEA